jgi:hypothetical protein
VATKKSLTETELEAQREAEAELDAELEAEHETEQLGWIDAIVKRANLPQLTDLGGALIVYNNLTCSGSSIHTFRRFPIAYVLVGRERRYKVDDIIAFAKKRLAEAPVRMPPPRRPGRRNSANVTAA